MNEMMRAYFAGNEIVYGVRSNRKTDSLFKRFTAQFFYLLMEKMGIESIFNHADYRLTSARVLDALSKFKEVNLFLRGMIPLVGFTSTCVYYERHERIAGKSHYPLKKMLSFAVDGITSLSVKPIRIITLFGFLCFLYKFCRCRLGYSNFTYRKLRCWMGQHDRYPLLSYGSSFIKPRCYRRVYWQNILRNKAQTTLHHCRKNR